MWRDVITAGWLLVLSAVDIKKKSVPLWLLGVGAVETAVILLADGLSGGIDGWMLCRSLIPGTVFLATAAATGKAGYGDGIVLIMLGLMSGAKVCLLVMTAGLFLLAIFSGVLLALRKVQRTSRIPFLPFLAVGWTIAVCGKVGVL